MEPQQSFPDIAYPPPPPYPYAGVYGPFDAPARHSRRRTALIVVSALAAAGAVAGVSYAAGHATVKGVGSAVGAGSGSPNNRYGNGGTGTPSTGTTGLTTASAQQSVGVVDIDTVLGYQQARAAGTGIVLTSSGEILTNNHVVDGATKISVTVVSTGRTYAGTVVGTDPTQDIAVIQLSGASSLQTANLGDSSTLHTGASVTGVGNAGGTGGTPSAATGQITALNQQLTATDDTGANPEQLTGMIETNAPIVAGDSGGPLYDSANKVIGMDTAAATNRRATVAGYAIPIGKGVAIATQIESGTPTSTIHIGYPGFLGVSVEDAPTGGALITGVVPGDPAAGAGITAGDVVTSVNGNTVSSGNALKAALSGDKPGTQVRIGWTEVGGSAHTATVTLVAGPAD